MLINQEFYIRHQTMIFYFYNEPSLLMIKYKTKFMTP